MINGFRRIPPRRKRRYGRALLIYFVILSLVGLRGCVVRPGTNFPGAYFNLSKNAAWIGVEWTNEAHSSDEIAALANALHDHESVYAFAYTSYLKDTGQFNPTYAHAAEFTRTLKATQPGLKVLAWIGLPLSYVNLGDPATRQKITAFAASCIKDLGFDGVHLDPEPIDDGDTNLLALLDETRQSTRAVNPDAILSLAAHKIWPIFPDLPWTRFVGPIFWTGDYYREVARRVDQVAVMTYDSSLSSPLLYRQWTRFQTIQVSKALASTHVEILMGIPTSEEETVTHHANAENMLSGLQGVIDGLNDAEAIPENVTGVAIYPYWETDSVEWSTYHDLWIGKMR